MILQRIIPLLICCFLLVAPALAMTITAEDVSSYSIVADPGSVFYKIKINDLPIGTNQTHTLMYQGYPYLLTINTWTSYGLWKNADISLTMPNGTVQTSHSSATTIVGSYSTIIQPTMRADSSVLESATNMFFTVDLNIGLVPVSAQFSTAPMGYNPSTSIPFTAASGSFEAITDVYVYQVTEQEFIDTIVTYNPAAGLPDLGAAVFQWTRNGVLGFANMFPVIGPIFVSFLELAGTVLSELFFWLKWIVYNFPAILLSVETLIMMMSVINAPKGKRALGGTLRNLYRYNVAVAQGFMILFNYVDEWLYRALQTIASIIQALKPL